VTVQAARVVAMLLLSWSVIDGCGGGGGGSSPSSTQPEPPPVADTGLDWDDGNWDEEDWQ